MTPTKNQITRERWLRGRLNYKLHAGQIILKDKYERCAEQLFVNECARQFGKSFFWVCVALCLAFSKPGVKIKYGTAFQTDLLEFILPTFEAVLEDCPKDLRPRYKVNGSKFLIRVPGSKKVSEIKLVGLDKNPNGLRGNVIDLIILDEAGFIANLDYLYKSVIIPATTHRPSCRIIFSSTPPSTPAHPFLDYVQKAEIEDAYIKMTIYDNPMINEVAIARLMKESGGPQSSTWRREYLCEHIIDANLALIQEWDDKYWKESPRDAFYPFYHKYVWMDLGVKKDFTSVLFAHYDFNRSTVVVEDEFVINGPDLTTLALKNMITDKELSLQWGKPYKRITDNNNPLLVQDLSILHDLHFTPTNKGTIQEMINAVRLMVANNQVWVHPRCKQLRGCMKYGVWDRNRSEFAHSKIYGHFDAFAALVYGIRNLDRVTNPIPIGFQVDYGNQILFQKERETPGASVLRNAFGLR